MAMIDFFDQGWSSNPDGAAYIMDERSYTFDEIGALSCRIANGLIAAGFGRGGKAAVLAANDPLAWTCTLGLWRAGMAWIPVNPRSSAEDNLYILDAFDCDAVFYQKLFAPMVDALRPRLPRVRLWVCIDDDRADAPALATWVRDQPATRPDVAYEMDDVAALMATGGTTGMPKGVMNTHRSLQTFVANYMIAIRYRADERPVNLMAAPMTHTAGRAVDALHGARRHRGDPGQARSGGAAGRDRQAPRDRVLPAAHGDLPPARHPRHRRSATSRRCATSCTARRRCRWRS